LIGDTLVEMEKDADFKRTLQTLKTVGRKKMTLEERKNRRRALDKLSVPGFGSFVRSQLTQKPGMKEETCGGAVSGSADADTNTNTDNSISIVDAADTTEVSHIYYISSSSSQMIILTR